MPGKKKGGGGGGGHADPAAGLAGAPAENILAALKEGPTPQLAKVYAERLRDDGPAAQWDALAALTALLTEKKNNSAKRAGCFAAKAAVPICGRVFEPVAVRLLPLIIELLGDKARAVVDAADAAFDAVLRGSWAKSRPASAAPVLPHLVPLLSSGKWEARESALDVIAELAKAAPEQTAPWMPRLVPAVTELLHDTKEGVRESAGVLLKGLFPCVTNRDFTPFKPHLSVALQDPAKVPACITAMASTTFVSTVARPELSLVVPLLVRGFRERGADLTPMIRKCARITENLSRLVEEPMEAELMLPELVPSLQNATEVVADKECRGVCDQALKQLGRIQAALNEKQKPAEASPRDLSALQPDAIADRLARESRAQGECQLAHVRHAALVCSELAQMEIAEADQWRVHALPYFWWLDAGGGAAAADGAAAAPKGEERAVQLSAPNTSPGIVLGGDSPEGMLIKGVKEGGPGEAAGLGEFAGRRITHINDKPTRSMAELKVAVAGQLVLQVRLNPSREAVAAAAKVAQDRLVAGKKKAAATIDKVLKQLRPLITEDEEDEEEDNTDVPLLCDCTFSLAYGTNILLHNTGLKLHKGVKYGLLGPNDCGKSTLMRAIVNGQVDGFPPADKVKTVYVEADIQGDLSHLTCLEYLYQDPKLRAANIQKDAMVKVMSSIGFAADDAVIGGKVARLGDPTSSLSGGWRMKLALARAMLQRADILLMDEPTNHLDVMNRAWVRDYLLSLKDTTCIMVSHDSGFLDETVTRIIEFRKLKLKVHRGNLSQFVKKHPEAKAFFELKNSRGLKFIFPNPEGVESDKGGKSHVVKRHLPVMKMDGVTFTYPGNPKPTIRDVTVRVSMASRVAVVGPNGAGKSTMIRLLTGEREAKIGDVWKHPNARIAYVAQHAFHHIERHVERTPNEYIRWRYEWGDDKEGLGKETRLMTPEEETYLKQEWVWEWVDVNDIRQRKTGGKAQILELAGGRHQPRKGRMPYHYEVRWVGRGKLDTSWVNGDSLEERGWKKPMKVIDDRTAALKGRQDTKTSATQEAVEIHLEGCGLNAEFGTHHQIKTLSGGQKVKVVLAAATWDRPHIIILDEPTNYLDRESLGALAGAIKEFEGGILIVSHNNQFCKELCPETWVVERQPDGIANLDVKGDPEWMENALREKMGVSHANARVGALDSGSASPSDSP